MPELVEGNTEFALDLYHVLFSQEENIFYSPYSLSLALAMTYAGARGETEQQMAQALHYTLPQAQLHPAFNALDQVLTNRAEGEEAGTSQLHMANALWGQQGSSFLDTFLDTLAENYGSGLWATDFGQPEEARQQINRWTSEQTEHRIEDLLPPGAVGAETELVLTNAITFKAAWMHPFALDGTHAGAFTLLDGQQVTVQMMDQNAVLGYAERPGLQAIELPFAGDTTPGALSMVILLPEAGTFKHAAQGLDAGELQAILSSLEPTGIRLSMPKFRFDAGVELKSALMELGMVDAFGDADFSGMDGTRELFIDEVYHKAFVSVDEAGIEAAASSAVAMLRKGESVVQQEVEIDQPFLFLVRDLESSTILFLGHVVNPTATAPTSQ
jgi:serpin B